MKRLIAFGMLLCCAIGWISGTTQAIGRMTEDIRMEERVVSGDPTAVAGKTIHTNMMFDGHLHWDTSFHFGPENTYDVAFSFTQEWESGDWDYGLRNGLSLDQDFGFGVATTGSFTLADNGYGDMIRAVAEKAPAGGEYTMRLRMKDYLDYHSFGFGLSYQSEQYECDEQNNLHDFLFNSEVRNELSGPSLQVIQELFRFPVWEDETVEITVDKDTAGQIYGVDFYIDNPYGITLLYFMNDQGLYCIPQAEHGEYACGMGLYFIPWKILEKYTYTTENGSGEGGRVALDGEKAENIYPMSGDSWPVGLEVDREGKTAWMLCLEGDTYVLTQMDLATRQILTRFELMGIPENEDRAASFNPTFIYRENLIAVASRDTLAVVDLSGEPEVDFMVPLGESASIFNSFIPSNGADGISYDGEMLVAALNHVYLADGSPEITVLAYNKDGLQYWGGFDCSLVESRSWFYFSLNQLDVT